MFYLSVSLGSNKLKNVIWYIILNVIDFLLFLLLLYFLFGFLKFRFYYGCVCFDRFLYYFIIYI